MLARTVLAPSSLGLILVLIVGSGYSMSQKYKYSNCEVKDFRFVAIKDSQTLTFEIRNYKIKRKIDVIFKKVIFPQDQSGDGCESLKRTIFERDIDAKIRTFPDALLTLDSCNPRTNITDGKLTFENRDMTIDMLVKKIILKKSRWSLMKKKPNWCN